ncbi:MAG: PAS domain S-box-containing protein [Cyclobacteriaceae bacterium]|jgi:PAS domain S-box-containing protein
MKKYTDLKELQLISETALESSLAGFWDWDILNNKEYLSPRFKEMFGYADHEMENSPDAWQKIAFSEDLKEMFVAFNKHVETKENVPFESIVRFHHKDGTTIWVRCNGKVVEWSEEGAPLRAIGCHVDITREKQLEISQKSAIKEKENLLAKLQHRFKNNLQLILSFAQLKNKDKKLALSEINDIIRTIAAAHVRIYTSDRFDKLDFKNYIQGVISPTLESQNIEYEIMSEEISGEISMLIPIGLIFIECVNNSVKHGFINDPAQKKINIAISKEGEKIQFVYNDNGVGYETSTLKQERKVDSSGINIMKVLAGSISGELTLSNKEGAKMTLTIDTGL